jgi:hemerythrin-like metal-binding protein
MRQNMHSVSASTEELSANMQSIASGTRQSNENIDSIQVSIKELTTASKDIAENSAKATAISKEAMQNVTAAFALVNELTAAAKQIDMVTATISEISDQTKLLALNATIESARAGEMGKGFAVVAKEVKDLASQTNTATKDIQSKIAIIHEVTRRTADAITTINGVMKSVNEAITSIAAAAEEQSVTTDDIAKNVVDATERIREMSNNVGEGAVAVQDVSKSILGATNLSNTVARSISELGVAGHEVQGDAVTSYAQALEVVSHGGDISRQLHLLKMPEHIRAAAEGATVQLCRFSSSFDVMVERMNDDHRRIFDYINSLHLRIKEKTEVPLLLPSFRELAAFTRAHFAREEEAMANANYPDLRAQKRAHEKLLGQVADIISAMETGADVDFIEVLGVFRDWLINHIMGMDRKYGPTLRNAGIT